MRTLLLALAAFVPLASVAQVTGLPSPPPAATPQPVSLLPAAAQPSGPPSRSYLFAKLGAVFPDDEHMTGFENGPAVEAGAGYSLTRNFALEGGLGYFATSLRMSGDDAVAGTFEYEETLRAVPLLASLRISGRTGDVEFFGLFGGGLYFLSLHGKSTSTLMGTRTGSESDATLGVHVAGGVAAYVSPRTTVGIEGRLLYAEAEFGGGSSTLESAFLTATLGYRF